MPKIINADCLDHLRTLPDDHFDAIVTDPPYGLGFMGKAWDDLPPGPEFAAEALRVLKPGGHMLAFGGTRTWHRLAVAIEDAGFEIRDSIAWLYGSGFPKSMDVSKAIDKANGRRFEDRYALGRHIRERREAAGLTRAEVNAWFGYKDGCEHWERQDPSGARVPTLADWAVLSERLGLSGEHLALVERAEAEREVVGSGKNYGAATAADGKHAFGDYAGSWDITAPATLEAEQWQGWGTALKPAFEPIVVARKPLDAANGRGTVAANVLEHGTGALNIDGCRIEGRERTEYGLATAQRSKVSTYGEPNASADFDASKGRWPANVILDEDQAAALDEQSGNGTSRKGKPRGSSKPGDGWGMTATGAEYDDTGGASRFFYVAKAPKKERPVVDGVAHPTVKPVALMRWLVRLVTPPGGHILDPFAGSGTTVEAALLEGVTITAIEREPDYIPLIQARIERAQKEAA